MIADERVFVIQKWSEGKIDSSALIRAINNHIYHIKVAKELKFR